MTKKIVTKWSFFQLDKCGDSFARGGKEDSFAGEEGKKFLPPILFSEKEEIGDAEILVSEEKEMQMFWPAQKMCQSLENTGFGHEPKWVEE